MGRALVDLEVDIASGHRPHDLARAGRGGHETGDGAAVAQDRHPVGDGRRLVELVGDEDDRTAFGGEAAEHVEERVSLEGRQHRGRLVKNEDAGVAIERLQDLDALADADRQSADRRVGVDREAVAFGELGDRGASPHAVDERPRAAARAP